MSNEVTNPFGSNVGMADRKSMAERAAASAADGARQGAPGDSDYMNFSGKRGTYSIGQDKLAVQQDELWVLNVLSFEDGWICWKGGKPASTRMANIYTGVPIPQPSFDELGPFNEQKGEGWYKAKGWVAKSLDTDKQGYLKLNSTSGVGEMADMIEEVARRMSSGEPCWPVFSYDNEEFEAQGFRNFKPIFAIEGWLSDDQLPLLAGEEEYDLDELFANAGKAEQVEDKSSEPAEAEDAGEDAPKAPSKRRSPKPKADAQEAEPASEKPAGRRRRRSSK